MIIREFVLIRRISLFSDMVCPKFSYLVYGAIVHYRALGFNYPFKSTREVFTFMRAYEDLLIEAV